MRRRMRATLPSTPTVLQVALWRDELARAEAAAAAHLEAVLVARVKEGRLYVALVAALGVGIRASGELTPQQGAVLSLAHLGVGVFCLWHLPALWQMSCGAWAPAWIYVGNFPVFPWWIGAM